MASVGDIAQVRLNTGEASNTEPWTDAYIGALVDVLGVTGATVKVWEAKAASVAGLVNVSEAGASHSASDLFKHYNDMLTRWTATLDGETVTAGERVRIGRIVRP